MSAQEMHDYLQRRYSRRRVLSGAAAGALAATGPVFWRRSFTDSSAAGSPAGPQWIALGSDPATEMHVSGRLAPTRRRRTCRPRWCAGA